MQKFIEKKIIDVRAQQLSNECVSLIHCLEDRFYDGFNPLYSGELTEMVEELFEVISRENKRLSAKAYGDILHD